MPDFSIILAAPEIRDIVQENTLERAFHDALYPHLLYRAEAAPVEFPGNIGDTQLFSAPSLVRPKPRPITPGTDPTPSTYTYEQWAVTLQQYADSIDTHMPTSYTAIANLFLRDAHQMGLAGGQTLNRVVRNKAINAAISGNTNAQDPSYAGGTQALSGTPDTLHVASLNGFTTARRPDLAAGSKVRFEAVSASNTLSILIEHTAGVLAAEVTAFTPDTAGDELGPGVISFTHAGGALTVNDRSYVISADRARITRVGGGNSIEDLTAGTDLLDLDAVRSANARMRTQNVPRRMDGNYHCHLDPVGISQLFADPEFQRLLTSLPDHNFYQEFAIGKLLGTVFFENTEAPLPETVDAASGFVDGTSTPAGQTRFSLDDPFAGELTNGAGTVPVHRALFLGGDAILEYYSDLGQLITEAGVTGKTATPMITNNGIQVMSDRIQLIIRAPLNRLQDQVSTSYKFIGDWALRTDISTGDAARYKRQLVVEYTE